MVIEFILHRPDSCIPWHPTRQHALEDVQAVIEPFELKMWAAKAPAPALHWLLGQFFVVHSGSPPL